MGGLFDGLKIFTRCVASPIAAYAMSELLLSDALFIKANKRHCFRLLNRKHKKMIDKAHRAVMRELDLVKHIKR